MLNGQEGQNVKDILEGKDIEDEQEGKDMEDGQIEWMFRMHRRIRKVGRKKPCEAGSELTPILTGNYIFPE